MFPGAGNSVVSEILILHARSLMTERVIIIYVDNSNQILFDVFLTRGYMGLKIYISPYLIPYDDT